MFRFCEGNPFDSLQIGSQQGIGPPFDPPGDVGIGRTPMRRVVLDPSVLRRIVRRGDDDAIATLSFASDVTENGVGKPGRRMPSCYRS